MFNRLLQYVILGGVFLIPAFIPFIVSSDLFFPFITGKNFAFRIIVEIVLAAWIILALRDATYRPRKSWILGSLAIFVAVLTLAAIFGENPSKSFWSNNERMMGLITYLHLLAYFLVTTSVFKTRRLWDTFFHISLGASVMMGAYALMQIAGSITINMGGDRLDATFGNSTYLAVYSLFHIFLALFYLLKTRKWQKSNIFYILIIATNLFMLVGTATRGAAVGLFGGLFLTALLIAVFEKERRLLRKLSVLGIAVLVLVSGVLYVSRDAVWMESVPGLQRIATISIEQNTAQSRFMIWGMSWEGFKEHPLLGWGQGNFGYVFAEYYDPGMFDQEPWFDRAHNIVFDWLIAAGVLGLLAYAGLYLTTLRELWRSDVHIEKRGEKRESFWRRAKMRLAHLMHHDHPVFSIPEKAVLTGLLAAYFIQNFFVFDNIMSLILFVSILGYVHTLNAQPFERLKLPSFVVKKDFVNKIAIPIVVALLIVGIYFLNVKPMYASNALIRAIGIGQRNGISAMTENFEHALSYNTLSNIEIRERLLQRAMRVDRSAVSEEELQEFYTFVVSEINKQLKADPNNVRFLVFAGNFYMSVGAQEQAEELFRRAYELAPLKQSSAFGLSMALVNQSKHEEARSILKKTFESEPAYEDARNLYASVLIFNGEKEEAKRILREGYGTEIVTDSNHILRAYLNTDNHQEVAAILEKRVENDPLNQKHVLDLAKIYLLTGRTADAVAVVRELIEKDSEFKDQGEAVIKQIERGEF